MKTFMFVRELIAVFFCVLACIAALAGSVSLFRFPDTYTRLHGAGLGATTACFSVFLGSLCVAPDIATAARLVLIILFFFISCPTATHIIARYAWHQGLDPWMSPRKKTPAPGDRQ
jgi:multicomponent Na+:H+ antiporter subunit G